jgi:hypothetical protein
MAIPIMLLLAAAPTAGSAADLNDGFLDLPWGAYATNLEGFKKLGQELEVSYYVHPDRSYQLDGIEVPNVVYGFYADRFFAVYIALDAIEQFGRLRKYINDKYGRPQIVMESRPQQTVYTWVYKQVKIKMKHREAEGDMKLAFYYTPLSRKANLAQLEAYEAPPKPRFPLSEAQQREAIEHYNLLNF